MSLPSLAMADVEKVTNAQLKTEEAKHYCTTATV
jgi:hypothetical protein